MKRSQAGVGRGSDIPRRVPLLRFPEPLRARRRRCRRLRMWVPLLLLLPELFPAVPAQKLSALTVRPPGRWTLGADCPDWSVLRGAPERADALSRERVAAPHPVATWPSKGCSPLWAKAGVPSRGGELRRGLSGSAGSSRHRRPFAFFQRRARSPAA